MSRWLHRFNTVAEYTTARNNNYLEPWVSYTEDNTKVDYNMTEEERRQKLYQTPLTFEITGDGNIYWIASDTAITKTIEYSKNDGEWTSITSNTGSSAPSISVKSGDTVQFRGDNPQYATSHNIYNRFSGSTAQFKVKGNIMSLINSTNFSGLTTLESAYTFYHLFNGCTSLTDASELLLPATTLTNNCYVYMFVNCTNLLKAPSILPATTLAEGCYWSMFNGCTSLTTAPSSIGTTATTMATSACTRMFWGCSSLTTAPELPATTLAQCCYSNMFYGCSSLTTAPELPATTLTNYCYSGMFQGCSSLTTAPELPATTLARGCYSGMFSGCRSLNYIKCLATDISAGGTSSWVSDVASTGTFVNPLNIFPLNSTDGVPKGWNLFNIMTTTDSNTYWVPQTGGTVTIDIRSHHKWTGTTNSDWITLTQTTGNSGVTIVTLNISPTANKRYGNVTFVDESNYVVTCNINQDDNIFTPLTFEITSDGTIYWIGNTAFTKTIEYSKNDGEWTSITSNTSSSAPRISVKSGDTVQFRGNNPSYSRNWNDNNYFGTNYAQFKAKGNIMSLISSTDFSGLTTLESAYTFAYLFRSCTGLTDASELILPATTLANYCYDNMFWGCSNLTTAPELPATTLINSGYTSMFRNCTSLTTAPELPATTLAYGCYYQMFYGCSGLTQAPSVLPATTLANWCYGYMFDDCKSLTQTPELPATTLADCCYYEMFRGCTNLTTAPELPATTLKSSCYSWMFYDCKSLTIAPELPATTLASSCYGYMFYGCSSLTTAPELPATTLANYCYSNMFNGCSNLSYIRCLATDISASSCTANWVSGVSSTGTFVKATDINWSEGTNGIPTGWSTCDSDNESVSTQNKINISLTGGTAIINVRCGNKWTATTSDSWVVLSRTTGNGGITYMTVTVSSTTSERHGNITFVDDKNNSFVCTVNQNVYTTATPLTFEITNGGNLRLSTYNTNRTIEYSKDNGSTWIEYTTSSSSANIINVVSGDIVQFRGNNTSYGTSSSGNNTFSGSTAQFKVKGNIMSLISSTNFSELTTLESAYTFYNLFRSCTGLTDASELILPATTLANYCYEYMFWGCSNLLKAPSILPATTLANDCYYYMFQGCKNLTTTPELPATNLSGASYCYGYMFSGCKSLTTAPQLPATTLAQYCYDSMFRGCTSLTTAPELPATTLAQCCYSNMFENCRSLTQAPELPATNLSGATHCYEYMFEYCTSLTIAPELPATTLIGSCYQNMFRGCTSLTTAPSILPATNLSGASYCYNGMFQDCINLTTAPELPATTLAERCYAGMFTGTNVLPDCSNIDFTSQTVVASGGLQGLFSGTKVTDNDLRQILPINPNTNNYYLPVTTLAQSCYSTMFWGCSSLTTAPELPATTLAKECYYGMFWNCTSLTTAPELPATTLAQGCYQYMFNGCTSLITAPELPATTLAQGCYQYMFNGCTSLITAPSSIGTTATTTMAVSACTNMFSGCTSLATAPQLPATTLANSCYEYMFARCTSLTTAPQLPATTLAQRCYSSMFEGCTSLTTAPSSIGTTATTTMAVSACTNMFSNCTNLTTVPELPATRLANYCYYYMFSFCTSLTTAPELSATTLAQYCYYWMFRGCTSLTTAPELPATTLTGNCYNSMFQGCTSLSYIKCLATDISATNCTNNWVSGVASTGTFVKAASTDWSSKTGTSGIPSNWTVQDVS